MAGLIERTINFFRGTPEQRHQKSQNLFLDTLRTKMDFLQDEAPYFTKPHKLQERPFLIDTAPSTGFASPSSPIMLNDIMIKKGVRLNSVTNKQEIGLVVRSISFDRVTGDGRIEDYYFILNKDLTEVRSIFAADFNNNEKDEKTGNRKLDFNFETAETFSINRPNDFVDIVRDIEEQTRIMKLSAEILDSLSDNAEPNHIQSAGTMLRLVNS